MLSITYEQANEIPRLDNTSIFIRISSNPDNEIAKASTTLEYQVYYQRNTYL